MESWLEYFAQTEWSPQWATAATLVAVLIAAFVARRVLLNVLARFFLALAARSPSHEERKRIETLARVLRHAASLTLIVVAVLVGLNTVGVSIAPILGAAGVAGVAIGFGAQSLVKDFFSGMFLLLENQIRVGDVVEIAGKTGVVEELTLRRTKLRSFDGAVHYISNGLITTVSNFSTEFAFAVADVSVSYREDLDHVYAVMRSTAATLRDDDMFRAAIVDALEIAGVEQLADSAIVIRCRMKTVPAEQWRVRREFLKRLKIAFDREGISIPYPHRMLVQEQIPTRGERDTQPAR
ncbi:MAG: mechanosensitive ion channel family protein [Betaproteobacteria bacterium]|nr:mechanosensitive ion channel family protein [Betaproteobacteria bacterium]